MQTMIDKAAQLTAKQLQDWLRANVANTEIDSLVVDAMVAALGSKMAGADYVAFCTELENLVDAA